MKQALYQTGLLTSRQQLQPWLLPLLLLMLALFVATPLRADGLFDFQMKLAQKGNAEAQFKIGEMYETGFGVGKDLEQAQIWINKAASQGHVVAGYKLLYWDLKKSGINNDNRDKVKQLKARAEAGNGDAQYYIGKMYAYNVGYRKDINLAQDWLNKAAIQGVLEAERELTTIREGVQRAALAKRRAEAKRLAEQKAKEELQKQEAEKARQQAAEKKRQQAALSEAEKQREAEQAEAERREREALERERSDRRDQLLQQRSEREKERKAKFESDPCSGKSARFLSTCR